MKNAEVKRQRAIFLTAFFVREAFIGPVMVAFYTNYLGLTFFEMTLFFSISLAARGIAEMPAGVLSDILGKKRGLICGEIICLLSMAALFLQRFGNAGTGIYAIAVFWGVGGAISSGNLVPLLHEMRGRISDNEFHRNLSYRKSLSALSFLVASISSGYLAQVTLALPVILDIVYSSIFIALCCAYMPNTVPDGFELTKVSLISKIKIHLRKLIGVDRYKLFPVAIISGVVMGAERASFNFLQPQLVVAGIDVTMWGWISSLLYICSFTASHFWGRSISNHFGKIRIIIYIAALSLLTTCLLIYYDNAYGTITYLASNAIIMAILGPMCSMILLNICESTQSIKSSVFSAFALIGAICSIFAQSLTGFLSSNYSPEALVFACSATCTFTLVVGIYFLNQTYAFGK